MNNRLWKTMPRSKMAVCLALVLCVGCAGEPAGPAPADQVKMMIANLPDSAKNPERWQTFFAPGAAPGDAERPKYGTLMLHANDATLTGDTGTVKVGVEDLEGRPLGDVEWTVVNEGGEWKIKTAPLP